MSTAPDSPSAAAARRVDADSPWLGLLPFTEETQRFFFGRDAEIREVFLRVRDHTLTVLYGQSGLGKTSLIGAGLIPKLRADGFRPMLLRLRFEDNDLPVIEQVRAALAAACASETESAETLLARWRNSTLWECFHQPALRADHLATAPPVLIFDQFEEIFTLGAAQRPPAEIEALAVELADLVENRLPASLQARLSDDLDLAGELDFSPSPLRLIITLREDFLSHLEVWKAAMPALMRNRMALRLLRGPQAREAVVRPGRLEGRNLVSEEVGAQIVRVIARQPPGIPLEEIEAVPPLLSLLCDELNRARDGAAEITAELVERRHGDILHEFYGRCFEGFPPAVRRFVEDRLVTVGGHRNQAAREDAEAELARSGVSSPGEVLNTLLARRLLSAEERGGAQRIEITHDVLAPLVTESRDKRKERERVEQAEAERRIAQENAQRIEREKSRLRRFAIVAGVAAVLAIAGMIIGFVSMKRAEEANRKSAALLSEAAQSDRVVAEEKLSVGDGPAAVAHLARAIAYEPGSTLSPEKAVAALNDCRIPLLPLAILQGHTAAVTSAQFSPDGQRIVTASDDKTARIWEAQTGKLLLTLQGHTDFVTDAQFSPDGQRVVTASDDKTARIWEARTGKLLLTLQGHTDFVTSAQFSPDGQRIVTGSDDNTARIWEAQTGKLLLTLQGHTGGVTSAQFSPDGQRIVTGSDDKTARIWEAQTGKFLLTLQGHTDTVDSAQFSPDGQRIVTASLDNTARIWEAQTGKLLLTLQGHTDTIDSAQFSPDGQRVVTASLDNTARIWEAQTGKLLLTLQGHTNMVTSAQFSPDGQRIVTASYDNTARIWEAQTGKLLLTLQGHTGGVNSAQFSPDGQRIVTASYDKTARIWEAQTGKLLLTLQGHTDTIDSAQFSPDGQRVVTASVDKTARIWEAQTGKLLLTLQGHTNVVNSAQFSPDGQRIVTASYDKTARIWEAQTGKLLLTLQGHTDFVTTAQFSPDGQWVVTASGDKTARIWEAQTGKLLLTLQGHTNMVTSAQFSPDGRRIVTASGDKTARIWEAQTGKLLLTLQGHTDFVTSAQFSTDGQRIVTASYDKTARIWEAQTGKLLFTLQGHTDVVYGAQFSPDGQRIVTASYDKTARIWTILPPSVGAPPPWFRDFLQYIAQERLNPDSELERIPDSDLFVLRDRLRPVARNTTGPDTPYLRILRHFVHD